MSNEVETRRQSLVKDYETTSKAIQQIFSSMAKSTEKDPLKKFVEEMSDLDLLIQFGLKLISIGKVSAETQGKSLQEFNNLKAKLQAVHKDAREVIRQDFSVGEELFRTTAVPSVVVEILQVVGANLAYGNTEGIITSQAQSTVSRIDRTKVFIVHGRNHKPMKELKKLLIELGLVPIVLFDKAGGTRTTIEKLEKHSDVGYAFVILTADDMGCLRDAFSKLYRPCLSRQSDKETSELKKKEFFLNNLHKTLCNRARQNVILELGYFIGKLGRDNICCLYNEDVELPSDIHGIQPIPFKKSIRKIRKKIVEELKEARYEMDARKESKNGENPEPNCQP